MTDEQGREPDADRTDLRVGDAERNAAVTALGEHMATGRLDLDEYGTRSAVAGTARTAGELEALFADLPAPHPTLPGVQLARPVAGAAFAYPPPSAGTVPAVYDDRSKAQKLVAAAAASSLVIALILFFTTDQWWWFLLIPLISSVAGSIWGDSWKRPEARG